ncbi:cupin domain-containing protein [Nocardiopsis sp. CC223A]|uniref:cupin domain-containing protein n=1 Tax=Nocardiopsis sp. CC223A TaxID=3044051 RepID=UPI002795B929|nr:cupin domain-containing protein [Nocardiopsis sp. CC223A]
MDTVTSRAIPFAEIAIGEARRTGLFEGRRYGSGITFFLVDNDPGQGPGLHRHPYTETWTVLEGEATITIGEERVVARAGDTAVCGPNVWHGFVNTGTGRLRLMGVHASDTLIQEFEDAE